ncbi:MAG: phasin family protein [Magnetococcales bacterium]|nr:phasin family protein [Magnetococcales bacterium]
MLRTNVNLTQTLFDAAARFQEIHGAALRNLADHQLDAVGHVVRSGSDQWRIMGGLPMDFQQVVREQAELTETLGQRLLNQARQTLDMLMVNRDEFNAMLDTSMQTAWNEGCCQPLSV